jgi:hypothetical protein
VSAEAAARVVDTWRDGDWTYLAPVYPRPLEVCAERGCIVEPFVCGGVTIKKCRRCGKELAL